jgi:hypothetical protein
MTFGTESMTSKASLPPIYASFTSLIFGAAMAIPKVAIRTVNIMAKSIPPEYSLLPLRPP